MQPRSVMVAAETRLNLAEQQSQGRIPRVEAAGDEYVRRLQSLESRRTIANLRPRRCRRAHKSGRPSSQPPKLRLFHGHSRQLPHPPCKINRFNASVRVYTRRRLDRNINAECVSKVLSKIFSPCRMLLGLLVGLLMGSGPRCITSYWDFVSGAPACLLRGLRHPDFWGHGDVGTHHELIHALSPDRKLLHGARFFSQHFRNFAPLLLGALWPASLHMHARFVCCVCAAHCWLVLGSSGHDAVCVDAELFADFFGRRCTLRDSAGSERVFQKLAVIQPLRAAHITAPPCFPHKFSSGACTRRVFRVWHIWEFGARSTGRPHPFPAEPSVALLLRHGFV